MIKRFFDLSLAIILAVPALLIFLLVALIVKLDSPGPALFKHMRVGRLEKPFRLWKVRTMFVDTDLRASHETSTDRVTRVGVWLRRTKIDEFPQIWSVLVGDMSFVGPRPCLPTQREVIEERRRLGVYALLPGITGPAQILGIDMSEPRKLAETDALYLAQHSLKRDITLVVKTFLGGGRGDAVSRQN